jgi:class 3 adenylate cyclase
VRNALARFNQVVFENDAARERARRRLLNAAKKYRIVPVGFITGQLQSERERHRGQGPTTSTDAVALPTGFVTLLMTDIEASTILLRRLGDGYGALLNDVRGLVRTAVLRASGREIDARADEFFAAFDRPAAAIEAAVALQRALASRAWPEDLQVRVRAGIHSGRPTLTDVGYVGLAVHTTARLCSAAHGEQIIVSAATRAAVGASAPTGVRFRSLGRHRLPGLPDAESLFQVEAHGLRLSFPRPRTGRRSARRRQPDDRQVGLEDRRRPEGGQLELPQPPT